MSSRTFYGWENVPFGTLVKSRNRDTGEREIYLKVDDKGFFCQLPDESDTFTRHGSLWTPDEFTTTKYKMVNLFKTKGK